MLTVCGGCSRVATAPDPNEVFEVRCPNRADRTRQFLRWGDATAFGSPAYWIAQYRYNFGTTNMASLAIGATLMEEVVACLLGGHGVTAEVALAAFQRLKREGAIRNGISSREIESALLQPLALGDRRIRYRFPRQRAERIALAIDALERSSVSTDDPHRLRSVLLTFAGVGPKTASWIVRNVTGCSEIAIIDIHIQRAGRMAGIFPPDWTLPRDYSSFELAFISYAEAGCVPAAGLDALIWDQMRRYQRASAPLLRYHDETCM